MYDLKLINKDLQVTPNGDIALSTTKKELATQWLSVRLNTILGEWFLDIEQGVNWVNILSVKDNKSLVDLAVIRTITETQYVKRLRTYSSRTETGSYKYSISFSAELDNGEIINFEQQLL